MLAKLRPRSAYDVLAVIGCFAGLSTGAAYAANEWNSSNIQNETLVGADVRGTTGTSTAKGTNGGLSGADISGQPAIPSSGQPFINGSLGTADIANNSLGGDDVKANSLTGDDINEGALVGVNAASVGGVKAVKFHYRRQLDNPPFPEDVFNLGGLKLTAECRSFGDVLDVKAFSSKDGASVYLASTYTADPNDTDDVREIDGDRIAKAFNTTSVFEVDNNFPGVQFGTGIGSLIYEAPDGSVVVVHLQLHETDEQSCTLAGVAIGG